jgi:magnesium chelatase subunit D
MPLSYPFSAIVGCGPDAPSPSLEESQLAGSQHALDDMGLALVLTVISPEIGGVLVRGEKGTAKSTAVRALAAVLPPIEVYADDRFSVDPADGEPGETSPDGPFPVGAATVTRPVRLVELPVGATEDRVLGSIHLERALARGEVVFEPGLLARAHRGVLYVDEVNLLHDHLVDVLLDAAAMGRVTVERDGVSAGHAARFVLIGTMNPEEGELRPQLLDRFGLTVEVAAPRDPGRRAEVVRRRLAYDADPAAFAQRYSEAEAALSERIVAARSRLGRVGLSDAALLKIAEVCAAFEVDGLRADIVTARTAVAHAAWESRADVTRADIRAAALLALPHRRRRNPFDAPGLDEELLDKILGDEPDPPPPPEDSGPLGDADPSENAGPSESTEETTGPSDDTGPSETTGSSEDAGPADGPPPSTADGPPGNPEQQDHPDDTERSDGDCAVSSGIAVPAGTPYRPRLLTARGLGHGTDGRRSRALSGSGHRVGARRPGGVAGSPHLVETLYAAARRPRDPGTKFRFSCEDLRIAVREGREANLILFCVDASGSMAARKRMRQVKTAILSLLLDAYRRRDKVGLITFRGRSAELALPPTHSVDIAARRLEELPAGGRTPLAEGLLEASRVLVRERRRDPRLRPLLVVVTDGRATSGADAVTRSHAAADYLAGLDVATVVIDGEDGPLRLGLAARLAGRLRAEYLPVADVSAQALTATVNDRTQRGAA